MKWSQQNKQKGLVATCSSYRCSDKGSAFKPSVLTRSGTLSALDAELRFAVEMNSHKDGSG